MDPNATLSEILSISDHIVRGLDDPEDMLDLAERCLSLHNWISKGGCLPRAWETKKHENSK